MTATVTDPTPETTAAGPAAAYRLPGLGGLVFVALAVVQNVMRAALLPALDARPDQVVHALLKGIAATKEGKPALLEFITTQEKVYSTFEYGYQG